MRFLIAPTLVVFAAAFAGCLGSAQPSEVRSIPMNFQHTFPFMWEQAQEELQEQWDLDVADVSQRTLTSTWGQIQLSPMGHKGQRHRIRVFIEGSDGEGYEVRAEQETEKNTNVLNPLSYEEADWTGTSSDGALADQFLIDLARRLHPRMEWKREMIR